MKTLAALRRLRTTAKSRLGRCGLGLMTMALALATPATPSSAQTTMKAMPLDCGGWFSGWAQADNGRLYGYGDVFGAWRSDDGGSTWSYLNWSIPKGDIVGMGMAVQKDNADVVYYSTNNALWKSINGGGTWTQLLALSNVPRFRGSSPILIRANNNSEVWFAGPRTGQTGWLWRSQDGGTSWSKMGGSAFDTNRVSTLHNIAAFPNQIWVGADDGLYASTNGGTSFTRVSTHPSVGMIQRFASGPYAGVGLITRGSVNSDGGGVSRITATDYSNVATYTATQSSTYSIYFGYPTGLQIFSDGTCSAWNTSADRHGFSTDGGQLFTVRATTVNTTTVPIWTSAAAMTAKNHPDYGSDQVIEAVGNPNKWMITGGGAPMYSMDKGLSWQYFPNQGGLAAVKAYTASVSRHDVNRIYVPASDIGSAIVTDGGSSGAATHSSYKSYLTTHGGHAVMEGPTSQTLVLAGVDQGANRSVIQRSTNGGANWTTLNLTNSGLPVSYDGITKSVMSFADANDFIVVTASAASDTGVSSTLINPGVWRTTNGGVSFTRVNNIPANASTGARYAPRNCFLLRDAVAANTRYFIHKIDANNSGGNFYRSTDGGTNWVVGTQPFPNGATNWVCQAMMADPIRGGNLWAAGDDFGVKYSRDGGVTWTATTKYFKASDVSSCDGKVAVFGQAEGETYARLWYSSDDGATWVALTDSSKNFHGIQGLTVDRSGKIWVSWNSVTVVTPPGSANTAPSITTNPSSLTVTAGNSATFNVAASGNPTPTLQWQRAASGSSTFNNLSIGGSYSGVTSTQLTVSGTTAGMSGDRFRAVATNSQGSATSTSATLTVNAQPSPVITSSLTKSGTVGTAISIYTITASNSPTSYGASGLPAGLSVNTSTGVISGTPTASGTVNTSISATNAGGSGSATLVFTIAAAPVTAPSITSALTATATQSSAFSYTITASNSPTSYGASGLPAGLSVNTSTGVISGTPTAAGTSNVTISATNSGGTGTATLVLTVNAAGSGTNNGTGLRAQYYTTTGLTGSPALTRTDATVNFSWSGSPGAGIASDNFSVRWDGQVEAPTSGSYTFSTVSDDGVRLWVNGVQIINNWTNHAATTNNGTAVSLVAGTKYRIVMEYYEATGGAEARLRWSYPGQSTVTVPQTRLYAATGTVITVLNPGFESNTGQTPTGWSTWANTTANEACDLVETANPRIGTNNLRHASSTGAYQVYTYQIITGLANGTYLARAWTRSSGGQTSANFSAKNYGGSLLFTDTTAATSGYVERTIGGIVVTNGQLELGFWSDASAAGQWMIADEVTLTRTQ